MASEVILKQKEEEVKKLAEQIKSAKVVLLTDYIGSSLYRAGGYGKRLLPARIFLLYFDKPDENTRFLRRKVLFHQRLADERE